MLKLRKHPNIIDLRDIFDDGPDHLALVMEYADGGDLASRIADAKNKGAGIKFSEVIHIFVQVALALQHCHRNAIVHRDIKPANIFLTMSGVVRLGDFGIARDFHLASALAEGSKSSVAGTPLHMAPEMLRGEPASKPADVWALGTVVWQMASPTLEPPFNATNMPALVRKIVLAPLPRLEARADEFAAPNVATFALLSSLLEAMLRKAAADRIGLDEVLEGGLCRPYTKRYKPSRLRGSLESATRLHEVMDSWSAKGRGGAPRASVAFKPAARPRVRRQWQVGRLRANAAVAFRHEGEAVMHAAANTAVAVSSVAALSSVTASSASALSPASAVAEQATSQPASLAIDPAMVAIAEHGTGNEQASEAQSSGAQSSGAQASGAQASGAQASGAQQGSPQAAEASQIAELRFHLRSSLVNGSSKLSGSGLDSSLGSSLGSSSRGDLLRGVPSLQSRPSKQQSAELLEAQQEAALERARKRSTLFDSQLCPSPQEHPAAAGMRATYYACRNRLRHPGRICISQRYITFVSVRGSRVVIHLERIAAVDLPCPILPWNREGRAIHIVLNTSSPAVTRPSTREGFYYLADRERVAKDILAACAALGRSDDQNVVILLHGRAQALVHQEHRELPLKVHNGQ